MRCDYVKSDAQPPSQRRRDPEYDIDRRAKLPPGPKGHRLQNLRLRTTDYTRFMNVLHGAYGEVVSYDLPFMKCCAIFDADLIREILVTQQPFFRPWFPGDLRDDWKYGSVSLHQGEEQRRRSEFMTSAFAGDSAGAYAEIVAEKALDLREACRPGRALDIVKELELFTWNALVEIILGRDVEIPRQLGEDILNSEKVYLILDILPGAKKLKSLPIPAIRRGRRSVRLLDEAIYGSMQRARDASYSEDDIVTKYVRAKDCEGAAGPLENDQAIRDELIILLTGFIDAPTGALAFGIHHLARNPEVRSRLEREVDEVLGHREIAAKDFDRLPYIRAVLKEVLRLDPPAPILLPKEAVEDRVVGGHLIPKGTLVHVGMRELHHRAEYWDDAPGFRPERWLEDPPPPRPPCPAHGYIPFGLGPHTCRGIDIAERLFVFGIASLAQQLRLEPESGAEPQRNNTAVGVTGPWMVNGRRRPGA